MRALSQHILDELRPRIGPVVAYRPLGGGNTGSSWRLDTAQRTLFLKVAPTGTAGMARAEAAGLQALAATRTVRVPRVVAVTGDYLLLEYLAAGRAAAGYWRALASGLAGLHGIAQPAFGFAADNYCGRSRQRNAPMDDGHRFFAECRLLPQAEAAARAGLLEERQLRAVASLCARLPELVPAQAPALLHGDLWSGNHFAGTDGLPVVIDPACYWGWPEADLAMMTLFGAPHPAFFDAYTALRPLPAGWRQRFDIYNLYHSLNHLNLFGGSYRTAVEDTLARFAQPPARYARATESNLWKK